MISTGKETVLSYLKQTFAEKCTRFPEDLGGELLFKEPLLRIADAGDPLFYKIKEMLGDFYWTPEEVMQRNGLGIPRSVIVWCLPVSDTARKANGEETLFPAREWAWTRTYGEMVNNELRKGLAEFLANRGYKALAPHLEEDNVTADREGPGWSCSWSERHTAFVAGMGTFGLSGGLITEKGIAHRLGSVVTDCPLEPDTRPYGDDPFAWCLHVAKGTCGVCIERCPVGSIGETPQKRDKRPCAKHNRETIVAARKDAFGWSGEYGCGLCQTEVPCETGIPEGI